MGVIQRQGIKQSIVTYIATFIGAINVLFVYTFVLSKEELGFYNFFIATGSMFMPFALMGTGSIVVRFFPEFENKERGHHGFLRIILLAATVGLIISSFLIWYFQTPIQHFYKDKMEGYETLFLLFIPFFIFRGYNSILSGYAINYQRIVVPAIFNNIFLKVALPTFCLLYYFEIINYEGILYGIIGVLALTTISFFLYIRGLGALLLQPIDWAFLNWDRIKRVLMFMGFGVLAGLGANLAFLIDIFMVGSLLSVSSAASYSIALFIADVIDVPKKALTSISSGIIAKAWNNNDTQEIKTVYRKASINLYLYASLLLILIWASLYDLFELIPNGELYVEGAYVVLILGFAKLIDGMTSVNDPIISFSKYYKFHFASILVLSLINIANNILLIPIFKINGAALATLLSIIIFNLIKVSFIKIKFGFHPFSWNHLKILGIALLTYSVAYIMPLDLHPFLNIIIRSFVIGSIFISLTLSLKISPDINNLYQSIISIIRSKF